MTTPANQEHPEITWDDLKIELLESDPDERSKTYIAKGVDVFGNEYIGSALFICDELEAINDIEWLEPLPLNADVEQAAKEYADRFYPIKDYSAYESDYDYRTQCAKNKQLQEHFIAGSQWRQNAK